MALSDTPMAKMMYRNALIDLSNGFVNEIDKTILASAPLTDNFITPYLTEETDAMAVMDFGFNSLSTWIEEAKKASYFSKHFVTLSKMIMSGVSTMARGLVTLHARGEDLSRAPMTIQDLIGVSSYHIRKSYLGVLQTSRKNPEIGERLLLNQLGWTNTIFRLFKTREKLQTESSKCKVQSSNLNGACTSSGSEMPVGNDVAAFEPFDSADNALSPLSAISAPGAYSAPRAFGSLGRRRGQSPVGSGQLPAAGGQKTDAGCQLPVAGCQKQEKRRNARSDDGKKDETDTEKSESTQLNEVKAEENKPADTAGSDNNKPDDSSKSEINETVESEDNSSFFLHNSSLGSAGPAPPPDYREILFRVLERSEGSEDGEIIFTEEEVRILLADPLFCSCEPELAEDLKQAFESD